MMRFTVAMVVILMLAGCAQPRKPMSAEEIAWQQKVKDRVAELEAQSVPVANVSVSCYGHGAGYIHSFYVQETIHGQFSRGMIWGGGANCGTVLAGYPVPLTWTPGMKVKVRWKPNGREYIEKTTTIPRYDAVGMLYVHFFPNDEVRVVVSQVGVLNPEHPIPSGATVPPPEMD